MSRPPGAWFFGRKIPTAEAVGYVVSSLRDCPIGEGRSVLGLQALRVALLLLILSRVPDGRQIVAHRFKRWIVEQDDLDPGRGDTLSLPRVSPLRGLVFWFKHSHR